MQIAGEGRMATKLYIFLYLYILIKGKAGKDFSRAGEERGKNTLKKQI